MNVAFNNAGNVIVQNSLTIGGLFTWTGGTLSGGGSLTAQGGMNISGNVVLDGLTLINSANATLDNGDLSMADGATMINTAGATIAIDAGSIVGTGIGAPTFFDNQGTITSNGGNVDGPFSNEGAIDVVSGGFGLYDGTSSGTITNAGETGPTSLSVGEVDFTSSSSVSVDSVYFYGAPCTVAGGYSAQATSVQTSVSFVNCAVGPGSPLSPGDLTFSAPGFVTAEFNATDASGTPVSVALSGLGVANQDDPYTLTGTDSFVVSGPAVVGVSGENLATISGSGSVTVTGDLTVDGGFTLDGKTLINAGNATLENDGGYHLSMADGATIDNVAGATIAIDAEYIEGTGIGAPTFFDNQGTITSENGGTLDVPFSNEGTIDVLSGGFGLYDGTSSGTITNAYETSATWLSADGVDFTSSSSVSADTVYFLGAPCTVAGAYTAQATSLQSSVAFVNSAVGPGSPLSPGTLSFSPSPSVFGFGGNPPATANFSATNASGNPVSVALSGLDLVNELSYLSVGSLPDVQPCTLTGTDSFIVSGPSVFGVEGYNDSTLSGSGSLTAAGGMAINGGLLINRMTLVNATNASWLNTGNIQVTNFGQIVNAPGAVFGSPGNASSISLSQANFLGEGASTVNGSVSNSGLVNLTNGPASLTINGSYTQTTSTNVAGTLNIELNGTGAGQYSQLLVNGAVSLAGALDLIPSAGFTSPVGSALTLISGNPTTGTFSGDAEGSVVTLRGQPYTITYHGGTGNNVVLTHVGITDTTPANTIPVIAGQSTGSQVLATFTDTYPNVSAANISGTINWGDNTSTAFTSSAVTVSGVTFSVSGTHTYASVGTYPVTVTINDGYGDTISTSRTQFAVAPVAGSIYVLDPTAGGALSLSGNASINTAGTVVVNSKSSSAILATGNATVTATGGVQVVGGVSKSGNAQVTKTGTSGAIGDPLAGLAAPARPD